MKKKVLWMIVALVVVTALVLGLTVLKGGKGNEVKYRTEAIGRGDIEAVVVTSGTLNPIDTIDIGAQVSGKITKLYADFNTPVKAGDIVAELDQEQLKMKIQQNEASYQTRSAALEQAKVSLQTSQKAYERAKALFAKSLLSVEEMDTAEANYLTAKSSLVSAQAGLSQAKSSLDQSRVDLSYAIIRSPVDGVVITRKVSLGQTLQSGFNVPVLFQVATDLTKMKVECDVDESDIGKVKERQAVRFGVEAYPNEQFHGIVQQVRVSPTTTNNVVTYTIIVNVDNPEKKLLPGMTATASIIVGEAKNVLRVPNGALRFTPTLSEAELKKMQDEMRERFMAQRQAQGGQPGAAGPGGAAPAASGAPQGAPQGGPAGQPGTLTRQGGGQGRPQMPRVWILDAQGKMRMAMIRTGVSDTSYSEIVRGDVKEGDLVILGTQGSTQAAGANQPGMGGMMFMGGPPGGRR